MKRVYFLNFAFEEGKITCSRLVLRFPSNSLCYQSYFSVTMASHFEIADEEYIKELKDKTRRIARGGGRMFSCLLPNTVVSQFYAFTNSEAS